MEKTSGPDSAPFSFVDMEHAILDYWEASGVFAKSLDNTSEKKPYIFYDGPPFATGLPHHGHLVASTIKDIVPRRSQSITSHSTVIFFLIGGLSV